jgi:hypothetical protein
MKRVVIVGVAIAVALIGYVAAGPFIVMKQIKSALARHDSEAFSSHVDFPALRANLKDQINAIVMKNAAQELKDNPSGAFRVALVSKLVDTTVDSFVTPSVLTSLLTGTLSRSDGVEPQQVSDQQAEPLRHARYSYDSVTKFSAWVKVSPADRDELRLVFTLDGLAWKLSNIVVPSALFDDAKKASGKPGQRSRTSR